MAVIAILPTPLVASSASNQRPMTTGSPMLCTRQTTTTTALSSRNSATIGTATLTASLKPARNTPPSRASSAIVISTRCSPSACGTNGFSAKCAVASEADSVIVMIQAVATKPSSVRTVNLPRQNVNSRSSMATEPCPFGLSYATLRYIGSAPNSVSTTISRVASGETTPAASAAIPGTSLRLEK